MRSTERVGEEQARAVVSTVGLTVAARANTEAELILQELRVQRQRLDAIAATLALLNETSATNREYIAAEITRFRTAVEASRCQIRYGADV